MNIPIYLQYHMNKFILFLLCSSLLYSGVSPTSQPLKPAIRQPIQQKLIPVKFQPFESQCCYQNSIFSLDRTWWMNQIYPYLGNPTGFPISTPTTLMGEIAYTLSKLRQFQDVYMGVHQFGCETFTPPLMNHQVPIKYPGIYPPQINSWCDLTTDLNVPFNHFTDQLSIHRDHTYLNLIFPASSFVVFPSFDTLSNFINAVNNLNCGVTLNLYVVEWWKFKSPKRNLQAVDPNSNTKRFEDLILSLGQEGKRLPQFQGLNQPEYDVFKLGLQNGEINYNEYRIGSETQFEEAVGKYFESIISV